MLQNKCYNKVRERILWESEAKRACIAQPRSFVDKGSRLRETGWGSAGSPQRVRVRLSLRAIFADSQFNEDIMPSHVDSFGT